MYDREYTPERITDLKPCEIFVFGSNLAGAHAGGAARLAFDRYGAVWGQGVGLQGHCYAIPTMQGGVETIKPYVDEFIAFASEHHEYKFLVTRIGCGIAGFSSKEMAPLFQKAINLPNVFLPRDFVMVLSSILQESAAPASSWDAQKDFLGLYLNLMQQVKDGESSAYYQVKELRSKVFRNTIDIVNQGHYITEDGKKVSFPSDSAMIHNTEFYDHEIVLHDMPKPDGQTIVEVLNMDCLLAGVMLREQGFNPAVLNMASRKNPGGGVVMGAGAQEETLFRRTNLFRSLYQFAPFAREYGIAPSNHQYPLEQNYGGIYTPGAILFREGEQQGYALMDEPVTISFISVAGMNRPDLTSDGMIADHHVGPIKNKIRTILRIGLLHHHDALVLGALGCGAFHNPPRHVAQLFHEVINEPEFKNRYRRIIFAILDDHNAYQKHNPDGNFKPFAEEFRGMDKPGTEAGQTEAGAEELKAIKMWTMGAGDSAKRFNGENPIPPKTKVATKNSWKILPMPDKHASIPINVLVSKEVMDIIRYGHIPGAMEDHWFMYCDDHAIRYFRSWSGVCIFVASYVKTGDDFKITELQANRDPEQYSNTDDEKDINLFLALLTEEYGGDAHDFWKKALG